MEQEKQPSMFRGALVYGLIVGLAGVVLAMVFYFIDKSLETWTGIVATIFYMGMVALGLVLFKKEYTDGIFPYGRVVLTGFLISLVAGIIMVLQAYALFQFDEGYLQDTKYFAIEQVNERIDKVDMRYQERLSDDDYAVFEERLEEGRSEAIEKIKERSAAAFSLPGLFNYLLLGVVSALITGIFIRKNKPEEPVVS